MNKKIRKESECMETFDTTDFGLAVALSLKGHDIILMHPIDNCCDVVFHFAKDYDIEQDSQYYWDGGLRLDPHEYWHEYQKLSAFIIGMMCHENN